MTISTNHVHTKWLSAQLHDFNHIQECNSWNAENLILELHMIAATSMDVHVPNMDENKNDDFNKSCTHEVT
jgi:hypothetical protein